MSEGFRIEQARVADAELAEAIAHLLPQLSAHVVAPTIGELDALLRSAATTLLVARDSGREDRIAGILTLALFRIPSGVRAWIEDVVVDESARGRGVGEALCREALLLAAAHGASSVMLTSRTAREAANRLYRRMGFELYETNVYRYRL